MFRIRRDHHDFLPEPVDDHPGQAVVHQQLHLLLLPAEHAEALLGVIRHVQLPEMFFPLTGLIAHPNMEHLIHPVMPDLPGVGIVTHQIIILIIPGQPPRTDVIPGAVPPQLHFLLHVPLIVLEPDLLILRDRIVDGIHCIIKALVHRLDPAGYKDLPLQLHGLVSADLLLQLPDQGVRLFLGNEFRRLDRVHQKLQFRQLEGPADHVVMIALPHRLALDLDSQHFQIPQIRVNALPVRSDIVPGQRFLDLRHGNIMLIIRLLQHDLRQTVQLEFLIRSFRHSVSPHFPASCAP